MMHPARVRSTARALRYLRAASDAWRGSRVRVDGCTFSIPGPRAIRLSVVVGNLRIHRLIDAVAVPGATVVDVGANIGYNTVYSARRVGPSGRVIAVEPTPDNIAVLERNVAAAGLSNVAVKSVAAGGSQDTRRLYVRGETSAVNSLFPESCYAAVTEVLWIPVERLDDLVDGGADLVKIDVEGGELDVLAGMSRLLRNPRLALIVEWHPVLQALAGFASEALPRWLSERGFEVYAVSHFATRRLTASRLARLTARLRKSRGSIELLARKA